MIEAPFADMASESGFERFVQAIGLGRESGACHTFAECLASPTVNPLHRAGLDEGLRFASDCADFAYGLRAYYLLRKGRPFYYVRFDGTRRIIRPWAGGDTPYGPVARLIRDEVSTDVFRYPGAKPDSETYQVRADATTIVPGTLFADPEGHVLVVYRVLPDGTIHMVDSQPSGRMNIKRVVADMYEPGALSEGGGFRRWRPFGALHAPGEGDFAGILPLPAFALPDALRGPSEAAPAVGSARGEGHEANERYWAEVRVAVARTDSRIDPVVEFGDRVEQLCDDLVDRVHAVDLAVRAGMTRLPSDGLPQVPADPFSSDAHPAWDRHSSPARDARLRRAFVSLKAYVGESLAAVGKGDDSKYRTELSPRELASAYKTRLEATARTPRCAIGYTGSRGERRALDLSTVAGRLADLAFDPVQCVELRWGATPWSADAATSREASACASDPVRWQRYVEQAGERLLTRRASPAVASEGRRGARVDAMASAAALRELDPFRYLADATGLVASSGEEGGGGGGLARTP